jgi:hypothetical protein
MNFWQTTILEASWLLAVPLSLFAAIVLAGFILH